MPLSTKLSRIEVIAIQQLLLLQQVIDYIEEHIKDEIAPESLATMQDIPLTIFIGFFRSIQAIP
jgi:hypothetical protein